MLEAGGSLSRARRERVVGGEAQGIDWFDNSVALTC